MAAYEPFLKANGGIHSLEEATDISLKSTYLPRIYCWRAQQTEKGQWLSVLQVECEVP